MMLELEDLIAKLLSDESVVVKRRLFAFRNQVLFVGDSP